MILIKWILSLLFALIILVNFATVLEGRWIINALFLGIAIALVFPPLDSRFAKQRTLLKSNRLRPFLAVLLAIGALTWQGPPPLSLANASICTVESSERCATELAIFAPGIQPITIQTRFEAEQTSAIDTLAIEITRSKAAEENETILTQRIELDGSTDEPTINLDEVEWDVGVYEVTLTPETTDKADTTPYQTTFIVLPSKDDVSKRTGYTDGFTGFKNTIDEVVICADPGGEEHCATSIEQIPTTDVVLADAIMSDYDANYTWLEEGPAITYALRLYGKNESNLPELLFQNTVAMEENTSVLGFPLGIGKSGLPPGDYDIVIFLDTADSKPVTAAFTVTE